MAAGSGRRAEWRRRPDRAAAAPGGFDPRSDRADPLLVARLTPLGCLRRGVLPWRRLGGATVVLVPDEEAAAAQRPELERLFGPVRLSPMPPEALARALARDAGAALVRAAERRVPARLSVRTLPRERLMAAGWILGLALAALVLAAPRHLLAALALLALLNLALSVGFKALALLAALRHDRRDAGAEVVPARLPVISLLVPLLREERIASRLLRRIEALDYPRDALDLCLIVEEEDQATRAALARARLPPWAQVVTVPAGAVRTKPRALNYALDFARGSVIGIYDAEDAPDPGQLRRVASTFARRGPETACLQGALDFYNPRSTWIARCFTLEYAGWFRVLLPGIERLGLVIPLGGTTLFLRREAVERLGGWDAHNVTEDADLGLRLARAGLRTEMIPSTTYEEANARGWTWVRQRSRWLKGYALTWAVHMRDPAALWRDLGPRRFLGVQVLFLGTLAGYALAPLVWSFWLLPFGFDHPLSPWLGERWLRGLPLLLVLAQAVDMAVAAVGARRSGRAALGWWAPALNLYFVMGTLAVWRGLAEVATCPFRWDKTAHGVEEDEAEAEAGARPTPPPASWRRRAGAGS